MITFDVDSDYNKVVELHDALHQFKLLHIIFLKK